MGLSRKKVEVLEKGNPTSPCQQLRLIEGNSQGLIETFELSKDGLSVRRLVRLRNGHVARSSIKLDGKLSKVRQNRLNLAELFDCAYLRLKQKPKVNDRRPQVRVVDLFCGSGFLSLGIEEAARACGKSSRSVLALDADSTAIETFKRNFPLSHAECGDVRSYFTNRFGHPLSAVERRMRGSLGHVDLLLGGPPCQGHSNLNNFTRGCDPKNYLYLVMARAAEVLQPNWVLIENVASVVNDRSRVVDTTLKHLKSLGYTVTAGVIDASLIGVPQVRKRHMLLASRIAVGPIDRLLSRHRVSQRSVGWAISDLERIERARMYDSPSVLSPDAKRRVDYLFDMDVQDLPDEMRPPCHRDKAHRYKSIYGRMFWNKAAQTITSGFNCMGQGRFVHPHQRRTITPHEAARIQSIPDFFNFPEVASRGQVSQMIGNGVPPKLAYVVGLEIFR